MDNFFRQMFQRREAVTAPTGSVGGGSAAATGAPTENAGGTYAERIEYISDQERALRIATYYRCMELRANTMAQLTPQYQTLSRDGGNYTENNRRPWRHLNYIMQRQPNPLMSAFEMWRQVEIETVARGNAFILIERDVFGLPQHLWLATRGAYDQLTDHYLLTWNGLAGPQAKWVPASDVIHVANTFRRQGGFMGISVPEYAADMLSLSKTLDRNSMETAAKGGRVKLIIGEEKPATAGGTLAFGLMNKGEMQKYARELNRDIYQQDVVAIRGLDKVQNVSMTAADMQLFNQREFGVAEICRVMAVPRTLAMDGSNSSYKTPEADRLDFLMNCIQPKRRLLEDELNRKLLSEDDFGKARIHLCELPLMMFDKKGQSEIDLRMLQSGAMTVNEIRKQYDMPAVEGGDQTYLSTNLALLGSEKLSGKSTTLEPGDYTVPGNAGNSGEFGNSGEEGKEGDA